MKRSAVCVAFFLLTGETASADMLSNDVCARLAKNSGIDKPAGPNGRTEWSANALNFGQRFVVGGAAVTSLGVTPVEPATVEEYRRVGNMCSSEGKGGVCRLVGPVNFKFTWKGHKTVTALESGERATVSIAGTKITCRSEIAH